MSDKDFKEVLRNVEQFKINKDTNIIELINSLKNTGFNAKRLALACEIYNEMINDKDCVKFFGLAGALVPVGLQRIIVDFIKEGFIDVLVTTGANLTHDLAEALGYHHLQGSINIDDIDDNELHCEDINRIYDVFMPNKVYEGIEDFISKLKITDNLMPVSSFLNFLGNSLPKNSHSILRICAESLQFCPNSATYAIQITMDRPEPGGLSGASLREAISWGKINEKAKYSTVISDATIALPLIFWYLKKVNIKNED